MREKLIEIITDYADFLEWERVYGIVDNIMECIATDNNVGKWIPVTERLPEDRRKILCYKQAKYGSCVMTAAYSQCLEKYCDIDFHGVKHGGFFDYDSEYGYYELHDVTHWMPLPPPPKEGAEQL